MLFEKSLFRLSCRAGLASAARFQWIGILVIAITPQAVGPNRIKLHTISIVSSVAGFTPVPQLHGQNPTQFLMNPVIDSREAETAGDDR